MSLVVEVDANRLADGKSGSHRAPACVESACVRGQHERLAHVLGRCDTQSESRRVSESRGDPPRGALRSRMRTACDLACGPRSEIARVHACGPARLSCAISHAGSHALAHAAAQRGRARDLTRNSARGLARGLAHALARVLARGPLRESPREPRCPCRRCLLPSDRRPQWPPLPPW